MCLTMCMAKLHSDFSLLIYYQQRTIQVLDTRLPVVVRLDGRKASLIQWVATRVDMVPALLIASAGDTLMEHIQVQQPSPMNEFSFTGDMGMQPIFPLHDCHSVTVIARIPIAFRVYCLPIQAQVEIAMIEQANRAARFLEIAAPGVALWVKLFA